MARTWAGPGTLEASLPPPARCRQTGRVSVRAPHRRSSTTQHMESLLPMPLPLPALAVHPGNAPDTRRPPPASSMRQACASLCPYPRHRSAAELMKQVGAFEHHHALLAVDVGGRGGRWAGGRQAYVYVYAHTGAMGRRWKRGAGHCLVVHRGLLCAAV